MHGWCARINSALTRKFRMGEINSTMPKEASRKKKTESADPYIQPIESEDKALRG